MVRHEQGQGQDDVLLHGRRRRRVGARAHAPLASRRHTPPPLATCRRLSLQASHLPIRRPANCCSHTRRHTSHLSSFTSQGTSGGVKRDISSSLTRGINAKRLCNRLKSKDGQMCELKCVQALACASQPHDRWPTAPPPPLTSHLTLPPLSAQVRQEVRPKGGRLQEAASQGAAQGLRRREHRHQGAGGEGGVRQEDQGALWHQGRGLRWTRSQRRAPCRVRPPCAPCAMRGLLDGWRAACVAARGRYACGSVCGGGVSVRRTQRLPESVRELRTPRVLHFVGVARAGQEPRVG